MTVEDDKSMDLRRQMDEVMKPFWWMREYMDDDSDIARDWDLLKTFILTGRIR